MCFWPKSSILFSFLSKQTQKVINFNFNGNQVSQNLSNLIKINKKLAYEN